MAAITKEMREDYAASCKEYQARIKKALETEKTLSLQAKTDAVNAPYKKIALCELMIQIASLYMAQNSLSLSIMNVRNNDMLNDARKILYKAIIYLEEIVTNIIDMPYADLAKNYESIKNFSVKERYNLITKLGFLIDCLEDAFGDNSKWKWSFVELKGRYAVVSKNFIDMRAAAKAYLDPGNADYETVTLYIRKLISCIDTTATGYRDKYEISTKRIDDMKNAIRFLLARNKLAIALNDSKGAEEAKSKAVVWNNRLKSDQKKGVTK